MTNIIYFEGLMSSFIRTLLIPQLKGDFTSLGYTHWQAGPAMVPSTGKLIVIGHSLGGPTAINWAAKCGREVDLLVTLDPRVFYQPYVKPGNVQTAINFRRNSWWMHGYPVSDATNIVMNCGHGSLPGQKLVVDAVNNAI